MKSRIITSVVSLCLTVFLLLTTLYAWYTSSSAVSTNNIVASTGDLDCGLNLQYFNGTSWQDVKSGNVIASPYLNAGDTLYYRLIITSHTNESKALNASFRDISSKIDDENCPMIVLVKR